MPQTLYIRKKFIVAMLIVSAVAVFIWSFFREPEVNFNADIKPILNAKCITCHGGVKAKAGFSVLFREEALAVTESGNPAIIPGYPDRSELIRRISHLDPDERMPFKHEPLSKTEIGLFRRWIKQGAKWGVHWAYLPVVKEVAPIADSAWGNNDIDLFILQKLREQKLFPSKKTGKATLLRRASLDLTGIYPQVEAAEKFLNDTSEIAYAVLVDSLLASPAYGERWASVWLDIARYADTKGYESDYARNIWKYRDWVIKAFNDDKPYDQFITEQIAGDLLTEPTDSQLIATAFHRNAMSNDEGGTDNEEFRLSAVIDRVNTTWEGMMSTTFACVQCHSHPYDPFRHEEYYQFLAYFNNTRDEDLPMEFPLLREYPDSMQQKYQEVIDWVKSNGTPVQQDRTIHFLKTWEPALYFHNADSLNEFAVLNNSYLVMRNNASFRLKQVDLETIGLLLLGIEQYKKKGELFIHLDSANAPLLAKVSINSKKGYSLKIAEFDELKGVHDVYFEYKNPSLKHPDSVGAFFYWAGFIPGFAGDDLPEQEKKKKLFLELVTAEVSTTPIMLENIAQKRRITHLFERGNWRNKGKQVEPGIPALFTSSIPVEAPSNRLGLAQWLTSKQNPLVARTIVNRLWEQVFGTGIVETLEDMGTQGIAPTHKELLDHLAWKLMFEYNWSIKKLLKEMLMSATYQQDSKFNEGDKVSDPYNQYFARFSRIRLSAEQVRDQGLSISGLLSKKMYGPGVMPWQPEGIWLSPYNGSKWENSNAEDQNRRAIYTYWKRSSPYPAMLTFDGMPREVCSARRIRTNTPLQALVTLNDSTYLNMARGFALRMNVAAAGNVENQIRKGYNLMMYKAISPELLMVFKDLYQSALKEFRGNKENTCEMVGIDNAYNNPDFAALIVVANAMLNLDEVITKN